MFSKRIQFPKDGRRTRLEAVTNKFTEKVLLITTEQKESQSRDRNLMLETLSDPSKKSLTVTLGESSIKFHENILGLVKEARDILSEWALLWPESEKITSTMFQWLECIEIMSKGTIQRNRIRIRDYEKGTLGQTDCEQLNKELWEAACKADDLLGEFKVLMNIIKF